MNIKRIATIVALSPLIAVFLVSAAVIALAMDPNLTIFPEKK